MLTGHGGVPEAVEAMRAGAYTFLSKPVDAEELTPLIRQAAREREEGPAPLLIGESEVTKDLRAFIEQLSEVDEPILLTGETGTGKEVVARALHTQGHRASEPFIAVNMACLPRDLIESELFGHVKGSFTGAHTDKPGLFAETKKGVLFLDEVAELPLEHQAKLLRVIELGEFRAVGGVKQSRFEGRLVTATHKNLYEEVQAGRFREDLYYRLQVIPIHIPPLRHRVEDIEPIFEAWAKRLRVDQLLLSREARQALLNHEWPGNVRELVNLLRRLSIFYPRGGEVSGEVIERLLRHTPFHQLSTGGDLGRSESFSARQLHEVRSLAQASSEGVRRGTVEPERAHIEAEVGQDVSLERLERAHIERLFQKYTNVTQVAKILEINRRTLQRKLKMWGLNSGDDV
jgi:DNA-binding NtrC family response regulator